MTKGTILQQIDLASAVIGKTWPLYAFVTSNPLTGYENRPFKIAIKDAGELIGGDLLPSAASLKAALELGEIDEQELERVFIENNLQLSPEESLKAIESQNKSKIKNSSHKLDSLVIKWLMAYMDEGLADWKMPNKEKGFYCAWKSLVRYDKEIKLDPSFSLPDDSCEALRQLLKYYSTEDQLKVFERHLSALPGWTGYIKYRAETNSDWQRKFSITLQDYLAVRLLIARSLNFEFLSSKETPGHENKAKNYQYLWLKAWELTWQKRFIKDIKTSLDISAKTSKAEASKNIEDAQLVFCIDTRSELIRRHIESTGHYETFGYAGFFGIAMDYQNLEDGLIKKSCPPILDSAYKVTEEPKEDHSPQVRNYLKKQEQTKFTHYFLRRMKNMLPSAFGFVEGSGVFYGLTLFFRTLIPGRLYNPEKKEKDSFESSCEPKLNSQKREPKSLDISLEEKTAIVKSAFDLMGWKAFSPLVLFVGHGSHTANNPFGSSLDCGACAASPGRHNARMLAKLANQSEVREALKNFNIQIPDSTFFLGAEHNTTTDEIVIFDSELPTSHKEKLDALKQNLIKAQVSATSERLGVSKHSISAAHVKTNDWSETRPEWGLAKNAGFVIGPRKLTQKMNLDGNCFLHSYDWEMDLEGKALEGIMQGPMVVTQWINNHYYFSTVDNETYGGGSKISHNITGKFGVMQGNGGDLKMGLPLQSVNETDEKSYHKPLRLSVFINAPRERVTTILQQNNNLKSLLDNEWIYLFVIDPTKENKISKYKQNLEWQTSETFIPTKLERV